MLSVNEIFASLEGEGVFIGTPQIYIRLQGCNVRCKSCDTKDSWDMSEGWFVPVSQIIDDIAAYNLKVVSLTGGNPLNQGDELLDLIKKLKSRDYFINIEVTGQDFNKDVFDLVDYISCDIKTPSTGVTANLNIVKDIIQGYSEKMQIKCVVADKIDFDFVVDCYKELNQPLVITPCWEQEGRLNKDLIEYVKDEIIEHNYNFRVIIQQHKVLYGSEVKGV